MNLAIRSLGTVFNQAAPGANTNIFATALSTSYTTSTIRATVVLATASVLNVTITSGATTFTCGLNGSTALNAGDMYTFTFGARDDYTYNLRIETDGVINLLLVDELSGAVT